MKKKFPVFAALVVGLSACSLVAGDHDHSSEVVRPWAELTTDSPSQLVQSDVSLPLVAPDAGELTSAEAGVCASMLEVKALDAAIQEMSADELLGKFDELVGLAEFAEQVGPIDQSANFRELGLTLSIQRDMVVQFGNWRADPQTDIMMIQTALAEAYESSGATPPEEFFTEIDSYLQTTCGFSLDGG